MRSASRCAARSRSRPRASAERASRPDWPGIFAFGGWAEKSSAVARSFNRTGQAANRCGRGELVRQYRARAAFGRRRRTDAGRFPTDSDDTRNRAETTPAWRTDHPALLGSVCRRQPVGRVSKRRHPGMPPGSHAPHDLPMDHAGHGRALPAAARQPLARARAQHPAEPVARLRHGAGPPPAPITRLPGGTPPTTHRTGEQHRGSRHRMTAALHPRRARLPHSLDCPRP